MRVSSYTWYDFFNRIYFNKIYTLIRCFCWQTYIFWFEIILFWNFKLEKVYFVLESYTKRGLNQRMILIQISQNMKNQKVYIYTFSKFWFQKHITFGRKLSIKVCINLYFVDKDIPKDLISYFNWQFFFIPVPCVI